MTYKAKQTWKDIVGKSDHISLSRRDLLKRGMATGFISAAIPPSLMALLSNEASAQALNCPPATRTLGAIAQIYAGGGPTISARFIGEDQAAIMNATMAANYGISGTNLLRLGPNFVIDTTSPFGATLLQGPNGFPGGATAWQTTVLNKISGGGHRGPFNADDGAGENTGLLGGASPFKTSQMNKDLHVSVNNAMARWARGLPSLSVSRNNLSPARLASLFSVTPAPAGLMTAQTMTDASTAASDLANVFGATFSNTSRNGTSTLATNAGCALYGNSALADPAFGTNLFTPSGISQLTSTVTVGALTAPEQALLAAYYQSAQGVLGGVILSLGGRDYHGQSPQNVIAPADVEEGRAVVMFLAACHAAQTRGSFVYLSNGHAAANGVQSVATTIGGTAATVNAPVATGDAGGSYNAGLVIFYDPTGSPPSPLMTGTISSNNGNARIAPNITSSTEAVSGLYLSALKWINNGTIPNSALTAMNISNPNPVMVI